jgi:uncharacterized protein (TIGR03437 family)
MANSSFRGRRQLWIFLALADLATPAFAAASSPTATTLSVVSSPALAITGQAVTYTATVGVASGTPTGTITFTVDGAASTAFPLGQSLGASIVLHPLAGTHFVSASYTGDQNYLASNSSTLTLTVSKAATAIEMASNPAQIAQPVAIRAAVTVLSPGAGTAGGTVDFANGTSPISGCTQVPVQNGVAICNTSFAQLGNFMIGTIYSGDANTSSSGGSWPLTVAKCSAGAYLAADNSAPTSGGPVSLGVLVLGAVGVAAPTGTVTISDGQTALATVPVGADGRAILVVPSGTLPPFTPGTHSIAAVYNGDANYGVSQAPTLTVVMTGKAVTATALTSTAAQIAQLVKITATVSVPGAASAVPGGTVDFTNAANSIASCTGIPLQNGAAVCNTTFLQLGTVTINASYSGDSNSVSSRGSMQLTVGKGPATAVLSAGPAAPVFGAAVTLSALVTGATGVSTPTGTVAFSDGTAVLGSVALGSDGRASLVAPSGALPALAIGTHSINAVYSGDANYLTGQAIPAVVVVRPATVVTLSSTTAQIAQPVKITAAVSSNTAGGTVDFSSASTAIAGCTGLPVQNGAAICNASFAQAGTVAIGASYSGDGNLAPGTASLQLTVGKCTASAYLASSPASPAYGSAVTLGLLVLGAPGVANPTVTFSDGTATLTTLTLGSDGRATLVAPSSSLAALSAGSHSISAVYIGDANYLSATATQLVVVVGKVATSVSLIAAPGSPAVGQSTTLTATVSPAGSGTVGFSNGSTPIGGCTAVPTQSGAAACVTTFPAAGTFPITASYSGDANTNTGAGTLQLTVAAPAKTLPVVTLTASPVAPVFGTMVTLSLVVAPAAGGPTPTGTVAFSDGTAALATLPLSSLGQVALSAPSATVSALAIGSHSIGAIYSGDSYYAGVTATPLAVTIAKAATSITLTAAYGGTFSASVTVVSPGAGTPTGLVQFSSGAASIGTAPLQPQGSSFVATLARNTQSGAITAAYQGDANFGSSVSPIVTVTAPTAQVTMASNHNPSTFGQTVTITVYVTNNSGPGSPTGNVQLLADGTSIGTATLAAGVAALTTASLSIGTHNLVANYAGDATYPAGSAGLLQVVGKGAATLDLSSSPSTSVFGQPVTFTAQWSQSTAPTGQIQFSDGASLLGSAVMPAGTAALTVANLAAGSHSITAAWSGDANWSPATSDPLLQAVGKAQTATGLTTPGSSSTKSPATLSATVAVIAPGAGVPTGTVKFVDGATNAVIATVALAGSSASTPLPATTDPIVAVYSGDANFQGSSSDPLTQLAVTNSASYSTLSMAADEIVTLFGSNLGTSTSYASPPADSLGGTIVTVTDSAGVTRAAQIFYVSSAQASILMPAGVARGPATLTVTNPNQAPVSTSIVIGPVSPGLFTANSTGQGVAAAQVIRVHADGTQDAPQNVAVFDPGQNLWVPAPIDLGSSTDTVYLLLYGTGIRHYASMPTCTIAGQQATVAFAGAQGSFAGLDQVNLLLPTTLIGAGTVNLVLIVDGTAANTVTLAFR